MREVSFVPTSFVIHQWLIGLQPTIVAGPDCNHRGIARIPVLVHLEVHQYSLHQRYLVVSKTGSTLAVKCRHICDRGIVRIQRLVRATLCQSWLRVQ